jgi:pyruvyltransferase
MKLRTYFWEDRIISRLELRVRRALGWSPYNYFLVGNAGDLFARELIEREYSCPVQNDPLRGHRLLIVGSIGHRIRDGDVVCGIGVKTRKIPVPTHARVRVWAVRGPITLDVFKSAGHDVSDIKFQFDPGLMMRFMVTDSERAIVPNGVAFIPHYRERGKYVRSLPPGMRTIDIDGRPKDVARAILGAELVYSSSLHGIIFAHALERPCVLVAPQTEESDLKYQDYFASLGLPTPKPLSNIFDARYGSAPNSPVDIRFELSDFVWPQLEDLRARGIAVS